MKTEPVLRYSQAFKRMVVEQIRKGIVNPYQARLRYGVKSDITIYRWMRKFGVKSPNIIYRDLTEMNPPKQEPDSKKSTTNELSPEEELELLRQENASLKEELAYEQLRSEALDMMINLAEAEFQISIRKKSGAKQSKH